VEYVLATLIGLICGGVAMFAIVDAKRKRLEVGLAELEDEKAVSRSSVARLQMRTDEMNSKEKTFNEDVARFNNANAALTARVVAYDELVRENGILKRDLQNLHLHVRKMAIDGQSIQANQQTIDERINDLGTRYLEDNVKWIAASINANNFAACKQRLLAVIDRCRKIDFPVSPQQEATLLGQLKVEFEKAVRAALEREEQARIKAQIREEQQREREIDRELKQLEREREAIATALERALRDTKNQYSEEVERLRTRLAEADERSRRAISQAQLTKSGHVYVISNIGAFGDGVFKIGMTRRLEPLDRVRELGDASVPFPFDVHMMISADDAPSLENVLHKAFHKTRLNKTNPRKEFFRISIEEICKVVRDNHGEVDYVADAEALQYRQSLTMSDADMEFIESTFERLGADDLDDDDNSFTMN
jgi:hypothetical protein